MAEGGVPLKPKAGVPPKPGNIPPKPGNIPPTEADTIDSLHMLFARDLITYVMRRQVPGWTFSMQYSRSFPCTPFSYRIRYAVDFYLNKNSINFDNLFYMAFSDEPLEFEGLVRVMRVAVNLSFRAIDLHNDMLRFLFLFAHFTVMAFKRGIHMAPYFAIVNMKALLVVYTDRKRMTPGNFYGILGSYAENLIHEDKPVMFPPFSV